MEEYHINILNLLAILVAAWIGGSISRRLNYPSILGELIVGIILGPGLLGLLGESWTVRVLAEVGIILLMVYIGMEIDFKDLKRASWPGFMAAIGGFIVPFVMGYAAIIYFGGTPMSALFVAIAVGVTSLVTKSRILVDLKLLNTRIAYVLMAGALISDTLALVIFAGILSFVDVGSIDLIGLLLVAGKAVIFFAVTILLGLYALPKLGAYLSRAKFQSSTLYFTIILIVAFGYAELAELAGMHQILGAFMAGLFIKESLFQRNIFKEVQKTFYDVSIGFMAPIFFVTAGFSVTVEVFTTDLPLLLVVILFAVVGKILGTTLFYLPSGYGWREGLAVGSGMNGRGAVEIVIAGIGLEMGIIDQNIFSILVFMAIFTTTTVPFLLKWTTEWLRRRGELAQVNQRHGYLLVGVNPVSLLLARHLQEKSPVNMIDSNKDLADHAIEAGFKCVHGNALKEEVLVEANAANKFIFIALTNNSEINMLAAQMARENFLIPNIYVAILRNDDGVGAALLKTIKATSMFSMRTPLDIWFNKISRREHKEVYESVPEKVTARHWVKEKRAKGVQLLPFLIKSTDGYKRPFHYGEEIFSGEQVVYLK
ncbi:cation:proton antiporter [Negadavirga shengliensis]|uniref:Cation:proton antiporter n=1 Tax=Negadavirga shengliensis TaxID=1389218 RepID=A0ABV9SZX4_9BACT